MSGFILRGINFHPIFNASGSLNFFGEGWRNYHPLCKAIFREGFDFSGSTFISKTTTLEPREGNMPLRDDLQSKEWFPGCVKVYPFKRLVLNSVGLSGPGAENLLQRGKWQKRTEAFMISFMSIAKTREERIEEAKKFVQLISREMKNFQAPFGIQINISCPNTGHPTQDLLLDAFAILEVFNILSVPLDLKIGVADALEAGLDFVKEIEDSGLCDCLTCSNTIPWGKLPDLINWQGIFGTKVSPLAHLGGGGLSGWILKPIVINWLKQVRAGGIKMPIKAGGGILNEKDAFDYVRAGASALEIGSVNLLAPWNVQKIIRLTNFMLG